MNDISIDQSLLKANSLKRSGQNDSAISIYEKILDEFPNNQKARDEHSINLTFIIYFEQCKL